MKKVFIMLVVIITIASSAHAQKGNIMINGNLGYFAGNQKSGNNTDKHSEFRFIPGAGYYLSDNFMVGLSLGYYSDVDDPDGKLKTKTNGFMIGPFARYYKTLSDIFSLYGQFDFLYISGKTEDIDYFGFSGEQKMNGCSISVSPHISANVGKGFAINFGFGSLGYNSSTTKSDYGDKTKDNTFGLDLNGSTLDWGISYTFNCANK
ncbi:MAG: porin family protein [Bacteroidetes bacterium]|nr:outer membrane beta-barrel protein [Bacteroidota bacterium]MCO5288800.1 porin family protein [Bacteroidota bacterium]